MLGHAVKLHFKQYFFSSGLKFSFKAVLSYLLQMVSAEVETLVCPHNEIIALVTSLFFLFFIFTIFYHFVMKKNQFFASPSST